jgi:hypothetical protein
MDKQKWTMDNGPAKILGQWTMDKQKSRVRVSESLPRLVKNNMLQLNIDGGSRSVMNGTKLGLPPTETKIDYQKY